jgi:hypothetical protein
LCSLISFGQSQVASEYQVKAVFLYNFSRFIDWPSTSFTSSSSPFVIGIIGDDPFGPYLEEAVAGENIDNHPIIIQHYSDVRDIGECHILYINYHDPERVKRTISALSNKSTLTVNEVPNFVRWGGIVQFFTEKNKIRLQINTEAAKSAQLKISSKLLSVAQIF